MLCEDCGKETDSLDAFGMCDHCGRVRVMWLDWF